VAARESVEAVKTLRSSWSISCRDASSFRADAAALSVFGAALPPEAVV
jgi:hypothetical protein